MVRFALILFGTLFLLQQPANAEMIPGSVYHSGYWQGAAYSDDQTGEFSHCVMSAEYQSGDTLLLSVTKQATITIGVLSQGLTGFKVGYTFPVTLTIDGRRSFRGVGNVLDDGLAYLELQQFDQALEALKRGYTLVIEGAGLRGTYNLTGTFNALEVTRNCAIRNYNYASRSAGNVTQPSQSVDKTLMFQVASMVVNELGLRDYRFLKPDELSELGWDAGVAWMTPDEDTLGVTLILPWDGGGELRQTDAQDTEFLASKCPGDYITSARSIGLPHETSTARELRLVCQADGRTGETYLSKFFYEGSIVYNGLFFQGADEQPSVGEDTRPEQSQAATLRAASFLLQ